MVAVELREAACGRGEFRYRKNKRAEHPDIRRPNVIRVVLQRGFKRQVGRRKKPGVIDGVRQQSAQGIRRHIFFLPSIHAMMSAVDSPS